jgi:hypothetical protein
MATTSRLFEIRLWIDATGSRQFTKGRLDRIVERVTAEALQAFEAEGINVTEHGGDWVASYPTWSGNISKPGRNHTTGV